MLLRHLALPALALLAAPAALAQGLPDARTGAYLPNAQAGAVEDATAILVNPAGLANVEGFELNLGGFLRTDLEVGQTDVDGQIALTPFDGVGLGLGAGVSARDGFSPRYRLSSALGVGDRSFAAGIGGHMILSPTGGAPDMLIDLGTQVRPARWLALAAGLEGLGNQDLGPASGRAGVSFRPLGELATVGVDVRVIPGSRDPSTPGFAEQLVIVPGAVVRVDVGGLAFSVGASVKNLGPVVPAPVTAEILAALELNGSNVGLWAAGGANGVGGPGQDGLAGVRMRTSSAAWEPLFSDRGRWLSLALTGEGVPVDDADDSLFALLFADQPQAVAILAALDNIHEDEGVEGVVLRIKDLSLGWARMAELRSSIVKLRKSGKKVVVHLDGGGDGEVFVASAADKVYLTPAGSLELNGLRAELMYFADTLDKIGVVAEAVSAGKYKSAPRTFTASEPSPEEIEVENALLDAAFGALTTQVAEGRGLKVDDVKAAIDRGGLVAKEAVERKIVDGLAYEDELDDKVQELAGHAVRLEERFLERELRNVRWDAPPRIALVPVTGTIAMGGGGLFSDGAGAEDIIEAIDEAARDESVRAIVLRVDSPGGDALASDLIWRAVMKARDKKPVIASMGDVAASGGYYVAAAAHTILAEPSTVTGSIGVFGLLFSAEELLDDIGVRAHSMERGALPGPTIARALTEEERAALQLSVDATYDKFLEAVVAGRGEASGLTKDALKLVAEGRVWTGEQAKGHKLVDQLGGILDAIALAATKAGIDPAEEVDLDVITGTDDDLVRLAGLGRALAPGAHDGAEAVRRALGLLLGDPDSLAFALEHEGKPLAVAPVRIRLR